MGETISRAQVEEVAALAQLELEPAELDLFARQLGEILAYATQVQQIDTTGIPPTAAVGGGNADRADDITPSLPLADALANAPEAAPHAGLFKVPRVIG